jgi:site-specific DNA-cytosine methylase
MKILELFSGTHSIGKVAKDHDVTSLDRDLGGSHDDYISPNHIQEDIMTWDYKKYEPYEFDLITASPVCLWWSSLRVCWINRKCKSIHPTETITKEHLENDINNYGKPMLDKVFEIIEYFKPKYWWIENPQTGRMKDYIKEKYPQYNTYYDVDYCKYSDWGYQKRTRFWTNIKDFEPKTCKKDCLNMDINKKKHKKNVSRNSNWDGKGTLQRYRIPANLIEELLSKCI